MTQIKNYNYNEKEISVMVVDDSTRNYLWVGFKQDTSGNCALQKVSAQNPLQKYYDIDISVSEIKCGIVNSSYLYLGFDDSLLIGRKYSTSNPLTTTIDFNLPSGINEAPVAILVDTYVNFLLPGAISGEYAKIVQFTTSGNFVQTIDLTTINNAISFTKSGDDFWVVTYENPSLIVRVYNISGGGFNYTINY